MRLECVEFEETNGKYYCRICNNSGGWVSIGVCRPDYVNLFPLAIGSFVDVRKPIAKTGMKQVEKDDVLFFMNYSTNRNPPDTRMLLENSIRSARNLAKELDL